MDIDVWCWRLLSLDKKSGKVACLTISFLAGIAVACLMLGVSLGAASSFIPDSLQFWVDVGTVAILTILGLVLIINPRLIHHHDEEHSHDHTHDLDHIHDHEKHHKHGHDHGHSHSKGKNQKLAGMALFGIGFVNMIIPCPTVAIMYKSALDLAIARKATVIFGVYVIGTTVAVGGVIYAIFRVTRILEKLSQDWVETALMRSAVVLTIIFAGYSMNTYLA